MPSSSPIPNRTKKQNSLPNEYELRRMPTRQRRVVKKSLMANVGYRLAKRKALHIRRLNKKKHNFHFESSSFFSSRFIGDLMCFLGVLGIILMIIECELTFNRVDHKDTTFSLLLKATITFTTIILVGLVFYYHRVDINLYCLDNSIDDWRIALTHKKIFLIILEAFICMIHPIPGHFIIEWGSQYVKKAENDFNGISPYRSSHVIPFTSRNSTVNPTAILPTTNTTILAQPYVPIDVMLSLPSKF
jgi:hypothetical protein